jgi:hypothetical protein
MSRGRVSDAVRPPLYARVLRLRHVAPSGFLCFIFLEGALALGVLLALAELVNWWGVLVLPATVAVMVKLNDVVAGALSPPAPVPFRQPVRGIRMSEPMTPPQVVGEVTTRLPGVINREHGGPVMRPWAERVEAQQQRVRQSASRRYE